MQSEKYNRERNNHITNRYYALNTHIRENIKHSIILEKAYIFDRLNYYYVKILYQILMITEC